MGSYAKLAGYANLAGSGDGAVAGLPAMPAAGSAAPRGQQRPLARAPNGAPDLLDVVPDADADADAEPTEDLAVRVAVRARPLVAKERLERARECLSYPDDKSVLLGKNRLFHFDDAYPPLADQHTIYANLVAPLVESCFNGYNATVLAYGQTGSGKTYTMGSGNSSNLLDDEVGVIPRVISDVFAGIERRKGTSEISVRCAFLEVHNEEVRDLLHPDTTTKAISIRERADGAIVVSGIREEETRSFEEMVRLLENGSVGRTTGGTKMNAESSRSHAIFTIILEQRHLTREAMRQHRGAYSSAKFHLVDLAGSERNKRTGAVGSRFKESININSGLLALGNVISALSDDQGRKQSGKESETRKHLHVPYRESKLTRLLQDSLGGNSRTCMIACVSPTDSNLDETLNTLKYAARARNIRNKPKVNRDPAAARLAANREGANGAPFAPAGAGVVVGGLDEAGVQSLRDAAESAERDLATARSELAEVTSAMDAARAERDFALLRAEQLEGEMAGALVVAGELNGAGQLTKTGFARLVAAAPESAREAAVRRRGGAPLPAPSNADRAAAAVALASPATFSSSLAEKSVASPGKGVIEGYLRELRRLEEVVAAKESESAEKEAKLAEAREDLERDEAIFAEKMREIKTLRRAARDAAAERERQERRHEEEKAALMAAHAAAHAGALPERPAALPPSPATLPRASKPVASSFGRGSSVSDAEWATPSALDAEGSLPATPTLTAPSTAARDEEDEAEKERLMREKEQIEREKTKVEEEAVARARQYQQEKKTLERQLRELELNISSKENLIADLERNEQHAKSLTQRYEARMRALEEEKAAKEAEVARLRAELEGIDANTAESAEEKRRVREQYEKKVRLVQGQLRKLQVEKSEGDELRADKEKLRSTAKVRELESEVTRMRAMQETLKRKLRDREERHVVAQEEQTKEIGALKRQADAQNRRIRELVSDKEKQRAALRKKTDELAAAQRELERLGADGASGSNPTDGETRHALGAASPSPRSSKLPRGASSRERARSYGEQIKGRGVVSARGGSSASAADVDAIRQLIDAEARRALERREGEEERRRIEAKREAVCREREEAAKARDALDLRKERVVAQLERERDDLVRALDALDDRLVGPEGASDELRDRRAAAANRLATLEDKIASGRVLSSEEERALRELEDRLDSLETEAEYIAAAHGDLASPRAGSGDGETAKDTASGLSPGASARVSRFASAEARAAVAVALERVVAAHTREREKDAKAAELEMQLGDAQSAIEEMENATRMREMDYDRRVTELRREHSEKEAYLMKLSERVAAQVDALERAGGPTAAAATTKEARASPDAFAGTALASPARAASADAELHNRRVAALTEETREAKSQNKQLKRRVKALLVEREELEAAAAKLEERLESSGRAAHALQEQVERLSTDRRNDRRGEASTSFIGSHAPSPTLPEPPRLPATPEVGADGAVRVSRSRVRAVSLAEVEAARLNKMTAAGYPGAGGSAAGRRVAAAIGKIKTTSARDGTSPVSSMHGRGFAGY